MKIFRGFKYELVQFFKFFFTVIQIKKIKANYGIKVTNLNEIDTSGLSKPEHTGFTSVVFVVQRLHLITTDCTGVSIVVAQPYLFVFARTSPPFLCCSRLMAPQISLVLSLA